MKLRLVLALAIAVIPSISHAQAVPNDLSISQVNSVLWTQQSIEHQAVTAAVYRAASTALLSLAKQGGWASLEKGPANSGRKAVILDLDETVLDNTPYNAWRVQKGEDYVEDKWQEWIALKSASVLPGAVEFIKLAKKLNVDVFFVSNRLCRASATDPCPALAATRENLVNKGIERVADADAMLLKGQMPAWSASDKSSRRAHIAQTHQIVMLIGDDMGDFLPVDKVAALRAGSPDIETARAMKQLGKRWFVVPNPIYGSWEKAVPTTTALRIGALKAPPEWAEVSQEGSRPLKVATWNMAWLADSPLSPAQSQNCKDEAKKFPDMDARPSVECRKGAPYRLLSDYERIARHAKLIDADIIGVQEVQGVGALHKVFDADLGPSSDVSSVPAKGTYFLAAYGRGGWQKAGIAIRRSILDPASMPTVKEFVELGEALPRDRRGGLEVGLTLKDGSKLTVLSVHLKSRCVDEALDANTDHCRQLAKQAPALGTWIAAKEQARERYIVLGDFNRSFSSASEKSCGATVQDCKARSLAAWFDDGNFQAVPVVIPTATLMHPAGCFDKRFSGAAIEHIVLGGGAEALLAPQSAKTVPYLDPATGLPIADHKSAVALFSDHCVVSVELQP